MFLARRLLLRPSVASQLQFHTSAPLSRKVLQKFKLADIGEGITECEVISWSVKPQGEIQAFDPLCEVQSDKASVEITSPFDGIVKELLVKEGEVAKVGAGLCLIEVEEDALEGSDTAALEPASASEETAGASAPSTSDSEQQDPAAEKVEENRPEPPQPERTSTSTTTRRLHPLDPNHPAHSTGSSDVLATPSVRHFARQKGISLADIAPGSGRDGRVEKKDVEAFLLGGAGTKEGSAAAGVGVDGSKDVVVELGRTRYGMWKAMVKSLEIPHFGYTTTLDLTTLHNLLPILNAHIPSHFLPTPSSPLPSPLVSPSALYPAPSHIPVPASAQYTKLTYLPILLKTLSKAMIEWPLFRASITPSSANEQPSAKPTLTIRPNADISIALSTPTGLYTPTLTSANTSSIYALASSLRHLSHLGRQTPPLLTPKEMPKKGGTITVSNVGALGAGVSASPVLVPGGGVAIVAIGRAGWVWDVDGERGEKGGERRLKVGVSWSADHRVVEGAELAAFVECWRGYVEKPERLIAGCV